MIHHLCQLKVGTWERGHLGRSLRAGRPRSQGVKLTQVMIHRCKDTQESVGAQLLLDVIEQMIDAFRLDYAPALKVLQEALRWQLTLGPLKGVRW